MTENIKTPTAPAASGKGMKIGIIVCAALVVLGIALWIVQLTGGMVQTNMRNLDSWGLYITCFMFFIGLSAGGLIISSVPNAFGMKGFGGISKVAIWTSICSTVVAVGFVVVDLGNPLRLWELFAFSNLSSPLMWDILVISTYLILSIVYLWAYLRNEKGLMSHTAIRVISVIALIVAILVHSVTAWIFSLAPSHEFWHTALMGPWFVASALDCGTALVLIVVLALRKVGYLELDQQHVTNLAKMLAVFVLVALYFFGCDLLTSGYFGAEGSESVANLLGGPLTPFFASQIICMAIAVVILVAPKLRTNLGVIIASALTIVGVFFKRAQIVLGGFQTANIESAGYQTTLTSTYGTTGSYADIYSNLIYMPTPLEVGVTLGVIALGGLLLCIGLKKLPLKPADKTEE